MKPALKPPGTKRFKLNCDVLLSTPTFKLYLRRYIVGSAAISFSGSNVVAASAAVTVSATIVPVKVWRCSLTL